MHESFKHYVETLHPSFERLVNMPPFKIAALPKPLPEKRVYLFGEGENYLYVGRTRRLRNRLRQHSIAGAQHNQPVFPFNLPHQPPAQTTPTYSPSGSRNALSA